ncbi:MAG: hypothetical protein EOP22_11765 [Hyphomicrobiales bacterium]|nr:MAG: hypothetical protein EOP22_11765 [Hyphomicrobiales bacterium]
MEKQVASADIAINAPVDTVWHAITVSKIALMPGTTVESGWEVGDPITFAGEFNGRPFKDYGEIVEKTEGRSVAFSHWSGQPQRPADYHIVRYALEARGDGTQVSLTQSNVGDKPDIDAKTEAEFEKNWQTMLAHLKKSAEAG